MTIAYLYFTFSAVFIAVVSTILGLLIYSRNPRNSVNRTFALFCVGVAAWSYAYIFWPLSQTAEEALFSFQLLHIGACYVSIFYLHFVVTWLNLYQSKKKILLVGYLTSTFFAINVFSPYFIRDMVPKFSMSFWAEPGILYHFYLLNFFGFFVYSCYLLFKHLRKTKNIIRKKQIKLILVGIALSFLGGSTNYFLWYNINLPPFGNIFACSYVILTAFAILKYHLFEIRVILTELLVAIIGLILFFQALTVESLVWKISGFILLALFSVFGYLLIKSTYQEIKRRREMEKISKDLKKAYKELETLDKAKSEFISIASHQLRTPLTAIKGYLSLINENSYGEPPGKMERPLKNIYISTERLIKLVNDLLSISRIESGKIKTKLEKLSLEDIINNVVYELKSIAYEKNIYLKWQKPKKPLPKVLIDKSKIRDVILNVIDNGIRYTQEGGVTVEVKVKGKKYQIKTMDTGPGMTKDEISNLFESFSRGTAGQKTWTEGTGLGLYIAKKFVDMHKGKIWAESPGQGKGSTFFIELPIIK